jgi:hypothetical protein
LKTSEEPLKTRKVPTGGSGSQVELTCQCCGKPFWTRETHANRAKYCSMTCRKSAPDVRKGKEMSALIEKTRFTPAEAAKIRNQIASYMRTQIETANNVVMGITEWNPTQARVFSTLLNKVVPDLNASYVQHEHTTKQLTDLTREELEAIAQGVKTIDVESTDYKDITDEN